MITFKLEDKDAEALLAVLGSLHFEPSFLASLKEQMAPVVEEVVEEKPAKKSKKAEEGDK